jgi:6-phosphogluconolactonase
MKNFNSFVIAGFLLLAGAGTSLPAKDFWVYFGTFTQGSSKGIYVSRLNADSGQLTEPELAAAIPDPSYIAVAPDQKHLYSDNELPGQQSGTVSAFTINRASGQLELLDQHASGGLSPCHISIDSSGRTLLVANYSSGSIASLPVLKDGHLGQDGSVIQYQGRSVNPDRQTGPHAHYLAADPSDHFALGCDLGTDKIMVYRLDAAHGTMTPNDPAFASVPAGSGPRHLVFSRDEKSVYVVNEMACSVSTFDWDKQTGKLSLRQTIPALPAGVAVQPDFTSAEILLHPAGRFIYVSVRGHDSISVFAVDPASGNLSLIQNLSSGGKAPRGLGIDPTGHWLLAGNQKTDDVVEFAIDAVSGQLKPVNTQIRLGSPVDFKFVAAN